MNGLRHLLAAFFLLVLAAPGEAATTSWTATPGLTSPWTREFEPHSGAVFAGTEFDGVFTSANGGISWSPVSGGLTEISGAMSIRSLDSIGGTLYAGTSAGLFKLSGSTWQPVAQAPDTAVGKRLDKAVQTVLSSGGVLLAGVASGGVYRSTDGGATFVKPPYGNGMGSAEAVWSLTAHPTIPNRVLAATGSGMYLSNDSGATWSPKSDGIPWGATTLRVVVHPAAPNLYYASTLEGVYRSITAGETWAPINLGLGSNDDIRGVFLQSINRMYAATQNGVYASDVINIEDPFQVRWRAITNDGLDNTIFWALGDGFFPGANTLLGGTQDGAAHITLAPPNNTATPTITVEDNLWQSGKTLTAHTGTWTGTPNFGFFYQWFFCPSGVENNCDEIEDATDNNFVLRPGDVNDKLRLRVTAVNAFPNLGAPYTEDSAMTPFITANPASLPSSAAPTLSLSNEHAPVDGFAEPGDTYTSTAGNWNNSGSTDFYQWMRCEFDTPDDCVPARAPSSALFSGQNYLLTESDVGFRMRVYLIGSNTAGSNTSPLSGSTNLIFPPYPVNLEKPVIVGQPYVGESLVGNAGTWKSPSTLFTRRWMRCNGEGGSCEYLQEFGTTYVVKAADLGSTFKLEVKGDPNGANQKPDPVYVYSDASGVIVQPPPEPVDPGGGGTPPPGGGGGGTPPPGGGSTPVADTLAPVIGALKAAASSFKRGKPIVLNVGLSEAGTVTVTFQRSTAGRRSGKKCVKQTRKNRRARKCTRWVASGKPVSRPVAAGASKLSFPTSKRLRTGKYRALVVVRDAAGNVSAVRIVTYRIRR